MIGNDSFGTRSCRDASRARALSLPLPSVPVGWLILLTSFLLLAFLAASARATTLLPLSDQTLRSRSAVVVEGIVVRVETFESSRGFPETQATIRPLHVFRGRLAGDLVVRDRGGKLPNGRWLKIFGRPDYVAGRRVLVFAIPHPDGEYQTAEFTLGKFEVWKDARGRRYLARDLLTRSREGIDLLAASGALSPVTDTLRDYDSFLRLLRVRGSDLDEAASTRPTGTLRPEEDSSVREVRPLWADWGTATRYRWDNGAAAAWILSSTPNLIAGGGYAEARAAISEWSNNSLSTINYSDGGLGSSGANFIDLASTSVCGTTGPFCGGGVIGCGGPGGTNGSNVWRGDTYGSIAWGHVEIRQLSSSSCIASGVFAAAVTHELGHTLGFGHSDQGASPHDVCRGDESAAQMRSSVQSRGVSLGWDDSDAARWVYGDGGNSCLGGAASPTPTPTRTATAIPPTATPTRTATVVPPTATPTRTATALPPTATSTPPPPTATRTPTRTPTSLPPTATPTPPPPTATRTPLPPTATPTPPPPTATRTPTRTPTSLPPTATPTPPPPTATRTPLPPTATPTRTPTAVPPTATPTSAPPASTATPTSTPPAPTATPTSTPLAPTATATPLPPAETPTRTPTAVPPTATPTPTATPQAPAPTATPQPPPPQTAPTPTPTPIPRSSSGPLRADFSWTPLAPLPGQPVQFMDLSTGSPWSWSWKFGNQATGDANFSDLQNPTHAFSRVSTFAVTLTVRDAGGRSTRRQKVVVGSAGTVEGARALTIPVAGHVRGVNGQEFVTDLQIENPGDEPASARLVFAPRDGEDSGPSALELAPRETRNVSDAVESLFQESDALGALRLEWSSGPATGLRMTSRTYTRTDDGTLGQAAAGFGEPNEETRDSRFVTGLVRSELFRTNLGAVNSSGEFQTFHVVLRGPSGDTLGSSDVIGLAPGRQTQVALGDLFPGVEGKGMTAEFRPVAGSAAPAAYAAVVDNLSGDPTYYPSVTPSSSLYLPGIACVTGRNGAFFSSDVSFANAADEPAALEVFFLEHDRDNSRAPSVRLTLAPRETRQVDDALEALFGLSETYGALAIESSSSGRLVVAERIYTSSASGPGTVGQQVDPIAEDGFFARGSILGLRQDALFRSNIGIFNPEPFAATVAMALRRADGQTIGVAVVAVAPLGYVQRNLAVFFPDTEIPGGEALTLSIDSGELDVFAFAAVIDNVSQDPTFSPGLK